MVSFLQINLRKSYQANLLAGQAMEKINKTVSLITEPHTVYNKLHGYPGGTQCIYDSSIPTNSPGPRAAIVHSKDLIITSLQHWCNRDCAVGLINLNGQKTILASIYLDINLPVRQEWLEKLLRMAEVKSYPVIIGMDSNAHSSLFGPDTNQRGEELENLILEHTLKVENQGDIPTFEARRGAAIAQTSIDVTLTRGLNRSVDEWHVNRDYNASDHNNIHFKINADPDSKVKIRPWSKTDWKVFSDHLRKADYKTPLTMSMKKLDKIVTHMYKLIDDALDVACPKIKVSNTTKSGHWATDEHAKQKQSVSKLYKRA